MSFTNPEVWVFFAFCLCLILFGYKGALRLKQILDEYIRNIEHQFQRAKDLCQEAQDKVRGLQTQEKSLYEEGAYMHKQALGELDKLDLKIKEKIKELDTKYENLFLHEQAQIHKDLKDKLLKELAEEVYKQVHSEALKMTLAEKKSFMNRQVNQMAASTQDLEFFSKNS